MVIDARGMGERLAAGDWKIGIKWSERKGKEFEGKKNNNNIVGETEKSIPVSYACNRKKLLDLVLLNYILFCIYGCVRRDVCYFRVTILYFIFNSKLGTKARV